MFRISPALRSMIHPSVELAKFAEAARKEGMRPLRLSAAMHVARGITTIEEVLGVLPPIE
jgi:general secretion pathway protein E